MDTVKQFFLFLFSSGLAVFFVGQVLESIKNRKMREKVVMTLLHECTRNEKALQNSFIASAQMEKQFPGRNVPVVNTFGVGYLSVFVDKFLFFFTFKNDEVFAYFDSLKNRVSSQGGSSSCPPNDLKTRKAIFDEYKSFLLLVKKNDFDFNFSHSLIDKAYTK